MLARLEAIGSAPEWDDFQTHAYASPMNASVEMQKLDEESDENDKSH